MDVWSEFIDYKIFCNDIALKVAVSAAAFAAICHDYIVSMNIAFKRFLFPKRSSNAFFKNDCMFFFSFRK